VFPNGNFHHLTYRKTIVKMTLLKEMTHSQTVSNKPLLFRFFCNASIKYKLCTNLEATFLTLVFYLSLIVYNLQKCALVKIRHAYFFKCLIKFKNFQRQSNKAAFINKTKNCFFFNKKVENQSCNTVIEIIARPKWLKFFTEFSAVPTNIYFTKQ